MQNESSLFLKFRPAILSLVVMVLGLRSGLAADLETPVIMAHRGASADAPENTAASIAEAIKQGAKVIEFDVRQTVDGVLVLFHDKTFERFTGDKTGVETQTWEAIRETDVGKWFKEGSFSGETMPLFHEAIEQCLEAGVVPLIEHKTGDASNYAKIISSLDCADRVIVQSFDWEFLREFQKLLPEVVTGSLGSKKLTDERFAEIKSLQPTWVGWNYKDISVNRMKEVQAAGFLVTLWTVNGESDVQRWLDAGIDGIITDYPAKMLRLLAEE